MTNYDNDSFLKNTPIDSSDIKLTKEEELLYQQKTDLLRKKEIKQSKEDLFDELEMIHYDIQNRLNKLKLRYIPKAYWVLKVITVFWLLFTITILSSFFLNLSEISKYLVPRNISPSVMIAFITTSLATVLGLWVIALKFFFDGKMVEGNGDGKNK